MTKFERRSWMGAGGAFCLALSAALAPLGCTVIGGGGCADNASGCDTAVGAGGWSGSSGSGGSGGSGAGGSGKGGAPGRADAAEDVGDPPDAGGGICGGVAGLTCPDSMYCTVCGGGDDHSGTCLPRPDSCSRDCPRVCGCDLTTYCNECEAHRAGVAIVGTGPCPDASIRAR